MLTDAPPLPRERTSVVALELEIGAGLTTPLHVHERDDETFRVLRGSLVLAVAGEAVLVGAEESFTAPAGIPHAVTAGAGGARYLVWSSVRSPERYADFQRAVAIPDGGPESPEERAVVAELARANDIVVLGPPAAFGPSSPG